MTRIAIVTGSTRNGRLNPQVAEYVYKIAGEREGAEYEIFDIADFDLPLFREAIPASMSTDYQDPRVQRWADAVRSVDGFVFIVSEHNRGITASLKSAIDYLYPEWNDKAAGIVTYGSSGGVYAGQALRAIMSTLQVATVTQQPVFNLFTDFENMATFTPAAAHDAAIVGMLGQVEKWAAALASTRALA